MARTAERTGKPQPAPRSWPETIAWYSLLATVVAVPLVTTLGIARLWGMYALTEEPYHTPKLLALSLFVTVATLAWLFDLGTTGRRLRWSPTFVALGMFSALAGLSTTFSPQLATSFFGASGLLTGVSTWLACIWTGVLVATYVTRAGRLVVLSRVTALTGAAVAVVAVLQAIGADPLGTALQEGFGWMIAQGMATTGNPNYTGALLVVPFAVSLALALAEQQPRWRLAAVACTALTAAAVLLTLTRAAWIGVAVATVVLAIVLPGAATQARTRLRTMLAAAGSAIVVAALLAGPRAVAARFSALADGLDAFSAGRLTLWADATRIIAEHPLLGTGADRLGVAAYQLQSDVVTEGSARLVMQDPHSLPLLAAAIFGIPAALALVVVVALALRDGVSAIRARTTSTPSSLAYAGWVAGLAGLAATSLLSVTTITLLFMLFLALGVVVAPKLRESSGAARWPSWAVGALALAVMLVGLWGTVQANRASNALVRSRYADSEAYLLRAQALTPWDSGIRSEYLFRKIGAMQSTLNGSNVKAAQQLTDQIDAELRVAALDFPGELLFYRIRILLHDSIKDSPGYRAELHRDAIDDALAAFPGDPEFTQWAEEFEAAQ